MAEPALIDRTFSNDGFWPEVPARPAIDGYRLVPDGRERMVIMLLLEAIVETNHALKPTKTGTKAAGYATLANWDIAHPEDMVDAQPVADQLYLSAVYALAKARAVRRLAALNRRPAGDSEAGGTDSTEAGFLDQYQNALGQLQALLSGDTEIRNFGVYVASI